MKVIEATKFLLTEWIPKCAPEFEKAWPTRFNTAAKDYLAESEVFCGMSSIPSTLPPCGHLAFPYSGVPAISPSFLTAQPVVVIVVDWLFRGN